MSKPLNGEAGRGFGAATLLGYVAVAVVFFVGGWNHGRLYEKGEQIWTAGNEAHNWAAIGYKASQVGYSSNRLWLDVEQFNQRCKAIVTWKCE